MLLALAAVVQIGVFGLFHPQKLVLKAPPGHILRIQAGEHELILDAGRSAALIRHQLSIDTFVAGRMHTAQRVHIGSRTGQDAEFLLGIEGRIERRFNGQLDVVVRGGELVPVLSLDRERAVAAVVAAEYPGDTPVEALKGMAVLARSYYAASGRRHTDFDFCDTTHCQFHRTFPGAQHPATLAAQATRGEIMEYQDRAFAPLYFASCDGRTRMAEHAGFSADPYPYFSVPCRHEVVEWTAAHDETLDGKESSRLRVNRARGNWSVKSNAYVEESGILHGKGEGHLVGMCQRGAAVKAGRGETYREILRHFYPNTSLVSR